MLLMLPRFTALVKGGTKISSNITGFRILKRSGWLVKEVLLRNPIGLVFFKKYRKSFSRESLPEDTTENYKMRSDKISLQVVPCYDVTSNSLLCR